MPAMNPLDEALDASNEALEDEDEMQPQLTWTHPETLFPISITELERKFKLGKGKQSNMWIEISSDLTSNFKLKFTEKRLYPPWLTVLRRGFLTMTAQDQLPQGFLIGRDERVVRRSP